MKHSEDARTRFGRCRHSSSLLTRRTNCSTDMSSRLQSTRTQHVYASPIRQNMRAQSRTEVNTTSKPRCLFTFSGSCGLARGHSTRRSYERQQGRASLHSLGLSPSRGPAQLLTLPFIDSIRFCDSSTPFYDNLPAMAWVSPM